MRHVETPFRVIRVERKACQLFTPEGPLTVPTSTAVTVGDWALVDDTGTVSSVLPRSTAIRRVTPGGQAVEQVLAANVDVVGVCAPLEPHARAGRIERLLALAWASGAQPLLVATKMDLCEPDEIGPAMEHLGAMAPAVEVIPVTIEQPGSVDGIRSIIAPDKTLVLLGASGVGKSSLVNALIGEESLATTGVRRDGKGRHTTAWRELVQIPGGGFLIDTPGLRAVGLGEDAQEGVDAVFRDVTELAALCHFKDCGHTGEPGCAVALAIGDGDLDAARLERYRKLQRELEHQDRRFDARARAEHTKKWVAMVKQNRKARP